MVVMTKTMGRRGVCSIVTNVIENLSQKLAERERVAFIWNMGPVVWSVEAAKRYTGQRNLLSGVKRKMKPAGKKRKVIKLFVG